MTVLLGSILAVAKNSTKNISQNTIGYVFGLILTTGRKNYRSIARENNVSYQQIYDASKEHEEISTLQGFLIQNVRDQLSKRPHQGKLIIDFTLIQKPFASSMYDLTYDLDGVGKRVNKGFSLGFVLWTNGLITIPLDFGYWYRREDTGDSYKKKTDIVIDLIEKVKNLIPVNDVLLDGAFATKKIVDYLSKSNMS